MDLYLQTTFVKSYLVGLGKQGRETPTGLWVVDPAGKLIRPLWTDPDTGRRYKPDDPDYPLGSRWIALQGIEGDAVGRTGIALHGTKEPDQIGQQGSRGCVRLHNGDVVEVYSMLFPGQSLVQIDD
jgi:lipoprotein-anchoring transpeptidase ErfK/SrfK